MNSTNWHKNYNFNPSPSLPTPFEEKTQQITLHLYTNKWHLNMNICDFMKNVGGRCQFYSDHHRLVLPSSLTFHSMSSIQATASSAESWPPTGRDRNNAINTYCKTNVGLACIYLTCIGKPWIRNDSHISGYMF